MSDICVTHASASINPHSEPPSTKCWATYVQEERKEYKNRDQVTTCGFYVCMISVRLNSSGFGFFCHC